MGIGELPDAHFYKDEGSNTLVNMARKVQGLSLPNLKALGLGNISLIQGVPSVSFPSASFGKMAEVSKGKDSTTGHWELAGIHVDFDFTYYPDGFPGRITKRFLEKNSLSGFLGNRAASGTEIIKELGEEHINTGYPIIYTSADSVFQIAAHEDVIPLPELYKICEVTRNEILVPPEIVGRVIARPFVGKKGNFSRTVNRKDFSMDPPSATVFNYLQKGGVKTISIGKVGDLFNYKGIDEAIPTKSNSEGTMRIIQTIKSEKDSFIFANLVDFDVYYGHRNDPRGFALALAEFDKQLPEILASADETDMIIITADHGNDPTTLSTDHSREYVPLLVYRRGKEGKNLGTRSSFSDVGKSITEFFSVQNELQGVSFLNS